jgi:hypothetical protein
MSTGIGEYTSYAGTKDGRVAMDVAGGRSRFPTGMEERKAKAAVDSLRE